MHLGNLTLNQVVETGMAHALTASGGRPCIIKFSVVCSKAGIFTPSPWNPSTLGSWQGFCGSCSPHPAFSLVTPTIHPSLVPSWSALLPPQRASLFEHIIQLSLTGFMLFCCFEAVGLNLVTRLGASGGQEPDVLLP